MKPQLDWMVLSRIPGMGLVSLWRLIRYFGTPEAVLSAPEVQIKEYLGRKIDGFRDKYGIREACEKEIEHLAYLGISIICYDDTVYPNLLKEISCPPPLLYGKGNVALLDRPCIGIVGSRAASRYGEKIAFEMARQLADSGVTVVSGLALGIDGAAHRGALGQPGTTIGVLGCGLDVVYPRQNQELFQRIEAQGLLLSEYPLGTSPDGYRFPARNRIIAGLSKGIVVVEAAKKSGSFITVQYALDEGRDIYAIPGRIDSAKSEGTHALLQQGAKLVHTVWDILEDVFGPDSSVLRDPVPGVAQKPDDAYSSRAELELLRYLDMYPVERDALLVQTKLDVSQFNEALLLLELDGRIEILPGGFVRKK